MPRSSAAAAAIAASHGAAAQYCSNATLCDPCCTGACAPCWLCVGNKTGGCAACWAPDSKGAACLHDDGHGCQQSCWTPGCCAPPAGPPTPAPTAYCDQSTKCEPCCTGACASCWLCIGNKTGGCAACWTPDSTGVACLTDDSHGCQQGCWTPATAPPTPAPTAYCDQSTQCDPCCTGVCASCWMCVGNRTGGCAACWTPDSNGTACLTDDSRGCQQSCWTAATPVPAPPAPAPPRPTPSPPRPPAATPAPPRPTPPPPAPTPPSSQCSCKAGYDYQNSAGGATVAASSRSACCAACWADSKCAAGVYQAQGGHCYLKYSTDGQTSQPGVVACGTGRSPAPSPPSPPTPSGPPPPPWCVDCVQRVCSDRTQQPCRLCMNAVALPQCMQSCAPYPPDALVAFWCG